MPIRARIFAVSACSPSRRFAVPPDEKAELERLEARCPEVLSEEGVYVFHLGYWGPHIGTIDFGTQLPLAQGVRSHKGAGLLISRVFQTYYFGCGCFGAFGGRP